MWKRMCSCVVIDLNLRIYSSFRGTIVLELRFAAVPRWFKILCHPEMAITLLFQHGVLCYLIHWLYVYNLNSKPVKFIWSKTPSSRIIEINKVHLRSIFMTLIKC
ncbi:uncharacterized protein BX663DRAFT_488561 [Cokeromyces recurvatus]|uniref:uncharacterized protein n=1 Tax=Cokeromyces recurvatus TaxID=90255 RepID=UPI00221FCC49|nr:uncharacterized protein BX663DRAFT_488561 [Cokeromyces recurvatus]KAI7900365.1 hypothetical protein BX663DRAFT_488561 [Cokeromyces recurvatus]